MLNNHGFDMWAEGYDKSVGISDDCDEYPFAGYKKLMNAIYNMVMQKRPAKILDIGIGTGTLASRLYEQGNIITGIDFSNEMLKKAKAKMPNANLIQYDFSKGLPHQIEGMKFDFIISTYALHHLTDIEKESFIVSLLNYINEAGLIVIGDVSFRNRQELEKCREACGNGWDKDEFYFVFSELNENLSGRCLLLYHQYSYCSGILEVCPLL